MQILDNVFNDKTLNIMVDLETTGVRPGCRVASIGLAYFTEDGVISRAYILPALDKQCGIDDPNTLGWWSKQSLEAKQVFADNITQGVDIKTACEQMDNFISECVQHHNSLYPDMLDAPRVSLWGNGATFDNSILAQMFYDNGADELPWNTFGDRCYRTAVSMLGRPSIPRSGTHHDACDDAAYQAQVLISALKSLQNASE